MYPRTCMRAELLVWPLMASSMSSWLMPQGLLLSDPLRAQGSRSLSIWAYRDCHWVLSHSCALCCRCLAVWNLRRSSENQG